MSYNNLEEHFVIFDIFFFFFFPGLITPTPHCHLLNLPKPICFSLTWDKLSHPCRSCPFHPHFLLPHFLLPCLRGHLLSLYRSLLRLLMLVDLLQLLAFFIIFLLPSLARHHQRLAWLHLLSSKVLLWHVVAGVSPML